MTASNSGSKSSEAHFGAFDVGTITPVAVAPFAVASVGVAMWVGWGTFWMRSAQHMMGWPGGGFDAVTPPAARAPKVEEAADRVTKSMVDAQPAAEAAQIATAAMPPAAPPVPVQKSAAKGVATARPQALDGPKHGRADDLQRINGIGPKLELVLNDLGIYHFDQIAGWTKTEIAWVDDYLKFSGRIERDDWVQQAKALAAGNGA